jgi:hypothetical protein
VGVGLFNQGTPVVIFLDQDCILCVRVATERTHIIFLVLGATGTSAYLQILRQCLDLHFTGCYV